MRIAVQPEPFDQAEALRGFGERSVAVHQLLDDSRHGRVIGRRLLQPRDYLGDAHDPAQRLEPGQSAQVAFLLREPSAATVAYTFEFR